ncbi:MAG TPA: hydrogen peroxide-dependent heme synthase [Gemmatimonadales bacterium]|nr:hydrogen peroxide-dependent heme synthase [Gemmatimonadales bacterium]
MTRIEQTANPAYPPETVEGWYTLHQLFRIDQAAMRARSPADRAAQDAGAASALSEVATPSDGAGWSTVVDVTGSNADLMLVHFRPTLGALRAVQRRLACEPLFDHLSLVYSFLSVTEAGLYALSAKAAAESGADYRQGIQTRVAQERASPHVQRRLYPELPADMPVVCFYPMSKKRHPGENWYELPLDERSRLMQAHGATGRQYAGRVQQIITGAIGLDAWEWGVTLFARDALDIKKLVTDMRFDEVSARYAEFGPFYVGERVSPDAWLEALP